MHKNQLERTPVTVEDLDLSHAYQLEAMINVLEKKGFLTGQEVLDEQEGIAATKGEKYAHGLNLDEGYLNHSLEKSFAFQNFQKKPLDYSGQMSKFEKMIIEKELINHKGSIKKVLDSLKIPRQTLRDKMKKYELHRQNYF